MGIDRMRFLLAGLLVCCTFGTALAQTPPQYRVDASWPADLPNYWILGQVAGIAVAPDDSIWIVHRPRSVSASEAGAVQNPPLAQCCVPAPSVLQFDAAGTLLQAWGGPVWDQASAQWQEPAYDWPANEHGIYIDDDGFVWLAGNAETDQRLFKFSADGQHLLTIGEAEGSGDSNDPQRLGRPADLWVDTQADEVYVADGYRNRRIAVFDSGTGAYKRHWGAYGARPDDAPLPLYTEGMEPAEQFMGPVHAIVPGPDQRLYVADRTANRIQVFERDGRFVRESVLAPWTLANGSVWDLAITPYDDGRWLFVADGQNMKVWILERENFAVAGSFGRGGRQAGQFDWLHNIALDSAGNLYTAEVNNGRRIQKFARQAP
jgi:DNA-binding beta-propeller fold protein YncE